MEQFKSLFADAGAVKLYAKELAENDNNKNQPYLSRDYQALNIFPNQGIVAGNKENIKARLNFWWLMPDGESFKAPATQCIWYPEHREFRLSGFIKGCRPSHPEWLIMHALMTKRSSGRILFLGITEDDRILGYVVGGDSLIAKQFRAGQKYHKLGVFYVVNLPKSVNASLAQKTLLKELKRIHLLGWINGKQLDKAGRIDPCNARNCGGYTIEAELGIYKNSSSAPDFMGWEVKQFGVRTFSTNTAKNPITLMTPEPTGGYYKTHTFEEFMIKYGYPDKSGKPGRINFGGKYTLGNRYLGTGLKLICNGYDPTLGKIIDHSGEFMLVDDSGDVASSWKFIDIISHWSLKHSKAAYVPSLSQKKGAISQFRRRCVLSGF